MTTGRRESPPSIGLTGSIGAGKSAALEAFARHGAAVLESDRIVHALYDRADVRDAVSERLGSAVRRVDGSIDRGRVAELVFAEPELRQWLEDLIHQKNP